MRLWILLVLSAPLLCAQQTAQATTPPPQTQSIVVTGTAEPIPLAEADRDVGSMQLPPRQHPLYDSWFDLLQLNDPELDLQQRAPGGFLGDLSIRGATFGQTLVLLNGMRINDVQTGHFNLDLPIPFEMIGSMEVLKGSGSTLYGSDAIGGVVNVQTPQIPTPEFRILTGAGNFGFNQEHAIASFGGSWWQTEIAAARDFSTGFMPDRDHRNLALSTLNTLKSKLGATVLLFAYSDRPYGANQFYGPYDSWERVKTWYGSAQQDLGENTQVDFSYRRHTDLFVLFRDNPSYYTNRHLEDTFVGDLRRHDKLPLHGVLSYGVQGLSESIDSTNLGIHRRTRASGYVYYDLRSVKRYSLSAGIREEVYGAHRVATSPSLSGAAWLSARFKLRASATRAFRLPSFTDLYYSDPSDLGNPNLKPETATSYEGGIDAYFTTKLHAAATVFQRRDTNLIDYVRANPSQPWQAENFDKLRFTGIGASVSYDLRPDQHFSVSFGGLQGVNQSAQLLQSKYAFSFPVHTGILEWRGAIAKNVIARTRIGVVDRIGRNPYALWDASAGYTAGRVRPYLQVTNLMNSDYQEVQGVVMPSRGIAGGLEIWLFGGNK